MRSISRSIREYWRLEGVIERFWRYRRLGSSFSSVWVYWEIRRDSVRF